MGFLERQVRTLGFLISILVEFVLLDILIFQFEKHNQYFLAFLVFLIIIILLCAIGQVKYYKTPGYKYTVLTWPGLLIAIVFCGYLQNEVE